MEPPNSISPPFEQIDRGAARKLGRARLAQRRARLSRIRRRVIKGSIATFAVAWAAIFVQLASGHDPALNKNVQASNARASSASTSPKSSTSSESSTTDQPSSSNSYSAPTQSPAPVTTQQS